MSKLSEQDFRKMLTEGNFGGIYMIYGDEKYLVGKYASGLVKKAAGDEPSDFSFHVFKSFDDAHRLADAVSMLPFGADYNVVYICDADVDSLNAKQQEDILSVLSEVGSGTVVVISQQGITPKESGFQKKLATFCDKHGTVLKLDKKTDAELKKYAVKWAQQLGCTLNAKAADYLLSVCVHDLNSIKNEISKLCTYKESGEIGIEDIDKLVSKNREYRIFQLADAVLGGNAEQAFLQLDYLFYQKERPEVILSVLSTAYIDMYRVKVALENGHKSSDLAGIFNYKGKEFRLSKAERAANTIPIHTLRQMLSLMLEADRKVKSTSADNRTALESLITQLILARQGTLKERTR